jgi:hypothetical protein
MRLLPTLDEWPLATFAFGTHPRSAFHTILDAPSHLRELLRWYGIPADRVQVLTKSSVASELSVAGQAEHIGGPPPSARHLDLLDAITERNLGKSDPHGCTYVSRAGMKAHFAGERYLEQALTQASVRVLRPERMSLRIQLRAYISAECLVFAEGSAVHGAQLVGRTLGRTTVLVRLPGWRIAEAALGARATSVDYIDVTAGLLHGLWPTGHPAYPVGLPILRESAVLEQFDELGIGLREHWDASAFQDAVNEDVRAWLELECARPSPPGSNDVLASSMAAAGIPWPSGHRGIRTRKRVPVDAMETS